MSSTSAATRLAALLPRAAALLDVAVAVGVFVGTLAVLHHGGVAPSRPDTGALDAAGVVLAACGAVPLVAWRRFPLGVFVVTAAVTTVMAGLRYPVDLALGPTAALYLVAASGPRRTPWTGRTVATVVGLFVSYLVATAAARQVFPGIELLHAGLAWAVAWFAGERTRLRREQVADLNARALRAERDAQRERLLAVAEERARIARDLHDSAGHAISVIAVRAGAARIRHHQDPDRSLLALTAVEELARQTAADIDQIVGTLRASDPADGAVPPPTGLASLDTLIAHHAASGLTATVELAGTPRPLGGVADQAAYRILQEALTNAARHGAGGARITLAFRDTALELTVTNPVHPNGVPRTGGGSGGHGLVGMRERATLLGGSLDTEHTTGTFRVHARIPDPGHHR
jgi:signal transduction histidine kinase